VTQISSDRIASIEARRHELAQAMARADVSPDDYVRLSKDYAAIEPVAAAAREVRRLRAELEVLNGMVADPSAEPELKEMAATEAEEIRHKLPQAERALAIKLLPRDAADERAAMLEVRAGTGGDEAALFAADLLRMYQRFAETQGWRFELISSSASELGGY
jgi:peptide chain release factor 1